MIYKPGCWHLGCRWREGLSSLWSLLFKLFVYFCWPHASLGTFAMLGIPEFSASQAWFLQRINPVWVEQEARWGVRKEVTWLCGNGFAEGSWLLFPDFQPHPFSLLPCFALPLIPDASKHTGPQCICWPNPCASQQPCAVGSKAEIAPPCKVHYASGSHKCENIPRLLCLLGHSLSLWVISFLFCHHHFSWVLGRKGNELHG